jgi:hypothetical protein
MQEQTPSSKWWKQLASLTMIALPTIFEMNFVEVWQSLQTCRFFIIQSGVGLITLWASSMLLHFAYMSTRLHPTKTSKTHPHWMICSWAHWPSSSQTTLAHAFSTPQKCQSLVIHLPDAFVKIVPVTSGLVHISHVPIWLHLTSWWHLIEHSLSILHVPVFGIHVDQATPYNITFTTTMNYLFMSLIMLFKRL